MTNEIEKTFFDTFVIKAKPIYSGSKLYNPFVTGYDYPQITDHILLELILIIMHHEDLFGRSTNIQELKDNTLKQIVETYNKFSTCVTYDGEYQQMAMDIKHLKMMSI